MLTHSVFKNLFCVHPPFYFQIDGNMGFVAGINEMLITEENGAVELIPLFPKASALRARLKIWLSTAQKSVSNGKTGLLPIFTATNPFQLLINI